MANEKLPAPIDEEWREIIKRIDPDGRLRIFENLERLKVLMKLKNISTALYSATIFAEAIMNEQLKGRAIWAGRIGVIGQDMIFDRLIK